MSQMGYGIGYGQRVFGNCLTTDYPLINDNDQWLIILNDAIKHQLAISSIYHYQISSYLQEKIFKLATLIGPDIPWPKNWNYLTATYFLLKEIIIIFFRFWLGILDNLVCTGVTTGTLSLCIKIINSFRELRSL